MLAWEGYNRTVDSEGLRAPGQGRGERGEDREQCCSRAGIRNHQVVPRTVRLKDGQGLRWCVLTLVEHILCARQCATVFAGILPSQPPPTDYVKNTQMDAYRSILVSSRPDN